MGAGNQTPYAPDTVTPDTWAEKFENLERLNSIHKTNGSFDSCKSCKRLVPAVYMTDMSQNFRLFHVSNLSVLNFLIFLHIYPGSVVDVLHPTAYQSPNYIFKSGLQVKITFAKVSPGRPWCRKWGEAVCDNLGAWRPNEIALLDNPARKEYTYTYNGGGGSDIKDT